MRHKHLWLPRWWFTDGQATVLTVACSCGKPFYKQIADYVMTKTEFDVYMAENYG